MPMLRSPTLATESIEVKLETSLAKPWPLMSALKSIKVGLKASVLMLDALALEPRSTKIESGISVLELKSTKAIAKFTKAMLKSIEAEFGALVDTFRFIKVAPKIPVSVP